MRRLLCFIMAVCTLLYPVCGSMAAYAGVHIVLNGNDVNIAAITTDSGYLLPFKELMNRAGVYVGYNEEKSAYVCEINGAEAEVAPNSDTACYDQVWIELDEPTRELKGDVAVGIDYIDKIYGISVNSEDGVIKIDAKIEKSDEDESDFDVEQYLSQITPKNIPWESEDLFAMSLSNSELISQKIVEVDGAPGFTKALEVENLTEPELFYRAQVTVPNEMALSAGDVLVATIWARKINCIDESGFATFNFTVEALDSTWTKFKDKTDVVSDDWTKFTYIFSPNKDVKAGGAQLGLRIGFRLQTIQFGGLSIVNYAKKADMSLISPESVVRTTYYGREEGALWREEALRRIEKYRKNDINIEVEDENGNPISGAKVNANMTKSEFIWGAAVNEELAFSRMGVSNKYMRILKEKFNSLTNETAMKTAYSSNIAGRANSVNFARDNNMHYRAPAVLWDALRYMPSGTLTEESTEEEVLDYLKGHASMLLYNYGDTIEEIDVVNEPTNNHFFMDKYGTDFVVELFKTIKDINPNVKCFLNETGISGSTANWTAVKQLREEIDELQEKGAPIEGIGIQNHTSGMLYPQVLYNQFDYLTKNLKYAAVTEYDYVSGLSNNTEALRCEADYLRDSIILAYSHPKMTSFTMWGFGDFYHWRGNAPLYFSSYNPKPALEEWDKYVWGEWFTQAEAETGEDGTAKIRGHRGDYDITVTVDGKSAKTQLVLTVDGENKVRAVVSDGKIELTSSQKPKQSLPQISLLDAIYNEGGARDEYKKLYSNTAVAAKKDTGKDVSFLLNEDNESVCALDKKNGIVVETDTADKNGYVTVYTSGDEEALIRIEVKNADGKQQQIYAGETCDGWICVPLDTDTAEIRISGLTDNRVMLRRICVSHKEIRRLHTAQTSNQKQ